MRGEVPVVIGAEQALQEAAISLENILLLTRCQRQIMVLIKHDDWRTSSSFAADYWFFVCALTL